MNNYLDNIARIDFEWDEKSFDGGSNHFEYSFLYNEKFITSEEANEIIKTGINYIKTRFIYCDINEICSSKYGFFLPTEKANLLRDWVRGEVKE